MDINALIIESLQLLALGMGAVFIILIVLILIITLVSRILPTETPAAAVPAKKSATKKDVIAAIATAVRQYRKKH